MHEKLLKLLLQGFGICCCIAIVPFLMPTSWMAACHEWLGMGPFPDEAIAEYLARFSAGLCAFLGVLALLLATNVHGYAAIIRLLAISLVVLEIINLLYGLSSEMPAWWIWSDAVGAGGFATAVIYLQNKINSAATTAKSG
jgi:uncharacterized membrane protein